MAEMHLEAICDTPFWNTSATWDTNRPSFTPCFTDTALTWVPALFLYLNIPYLIYEHAHSKRQPLKQSRFNYIKSLIIALNGVISAGQIAYLSYLWSQDDGPLSTAEILSSCIHLLTNIVLLILVHLQRRFGFINGGAIWFYFLLKIIATGLCIPTYLHYSDHKNFVQLIIIFSTLGIEIILLLICSFADELPPPSDGFGGALWRSRSLTRPMANHAKVCPKEVASFTSKLTFWWYNKLIFTGFRKDLSKDDLWAIRSHDKAANIFEHFNRFWRHKEFKSAPKKSDNLIRNEAFRNASFKEEISEYFTTTSGEATSTSNGHGKKGGHSGEENSGQNKKNQPFTSNPKTNVVIIIFQQFGKFFFLPCAARFVTDIVNLANPIVMKYLIAFTSDYDAPSWHGLFFSAIFVLTNISSSLTSAYQQHRMAVLGMRIRTALMSAIYRKSLLLAAHSKRSYTTGEIVNLCAVDSQRFIDLLPWICFLWTAPVQIVIAIYLLWLELGYSVMGGLLLMILFIPIQGWAMNNVKRIQTKQMELKDRRLKAITEMLNGMKVLKLYAWEEAMVQNIEDIRSQELHFIRMSGYVTTIFNLIAYTSPFMVTCLTFTLYIFLGGDGNYLTAEKAFVSVALFNMLRVPLAQIPNMATSLMLVMVALKRLNKFLNADETTDYVERTVSLSAKTNQPLLSASKPENLKSFQVGDEEEVVEVKENAIELKNASFTWGLAADPSAPRTLSNINLAIPKGSLVAVVGSVGSGKSSLLYALLGEMEKVGVSGSVAIAPDQQKLALVAQQAWIQNATVRDNILFGKKYSPDKYNRVIEACALKPDLAMLTSGDATEIGEKGINLSGGQKQRISIARACYSQAALYLFDDPLSAVDSHVGRHIFEQVLDSRTGILRKKTRVLVTNALYMLPNVDQIVLLRGGVVEAVGTYDGLMADTPVFSDLIANYYSTTLGGNGGDGGEGAEKTQKGVNTIGDSSDLLMVEDDEKFLEAGLVPDETRAMLGRTFSVTSGLTLFSTRERHNSIASSPSMLLLQHLQNQKNGVKNAAPSAYDELKAKSKLVEAEKVESGQVTFAVYRKFFASLGFSWSAAILFFYFMMVVSSYGANFWLSHWTDSQDDSILTGNQTESEEVEQYEKQTKKNLLIYFLIGATQFLFVICGWLSIIRGTIRASTNLHAALISSIVHAPMWFFDTTPLGRIVNRFSKDIDVLDTAMAMLIRILMNHSFNVLATMFTVSVQTPLFLAVVIPFMIIYGLIQRFYVATTRQLKRLESVTRSPIFTHFSETIGGVSTIRAYQATSRFIEEADTRIDSNTAAFYPNAVANCWLQVRLEMMAAVLTFFAALFAVLGKKTSEEEAGGLSGGGIGLSLSYALNMTLALNMCVRMYAELENNIVSVERISEYTSVEPEAPWFKEADEKLGPDWPEVGRLCFESYGTRYRPGLDLVLRSIDLTTTRAEKIGIVGRTGAGKSSLTLALFRLIEAATGRIWMDGIDISTLGLQTLRSRITIIPQEPVLFCGTIRQNLDPFGRYTDDQLWKVLELAHLKPFVNSLGNGLSHTVSEGGENLSVGQRQLVCLARALLRKTNVLVLDEATAAVDLETDSLIQTTIRAQFAHCTIFTIAHRINTILDSDRVLVLDAGNVAEFDSPANLLADSDTIFYSLAKDAGII